MERRRYPRFPANTPAVITVLGEPTNCLNGTLTDLSNKGMKLILDRSIGSGAAVQIEFPGAHILFLGEVVYCGKEDKGFACGVELEHCLTHLDELLALRRQLAADGWVDAANAIVPEPSRVERRSFGAQRA